jgi:hypothetical protein
MSVPGVDHVGERPLEEMVEKASQQAVVLAREQVDVAWRELAAGRDRPVPEPPWCRAVSFWVHSLPEPAPPL